MLLDWLQRRFRARRMAELARLARLTERTRVLDVGGTAEIWSFAPVTPRITFLNQARASHEIGERSQVVLGDGLRLPFRDRSFDLVFSNSVIEHVGDAGAQAQFAAELARVGKQYWVETPNRGFPVEQHLWTPVVHWLPKAWQRRLVPRCSLWALLTKHTREEREFYFRHYLDSVHLLSEADLRALFPGAIVLRERFLGWPKALVAWRKESVT